MHCKEEALRTSQNRGEAAPRSRGLAASRTLFTVGSLVLLLAFAIDSPFALAKRISGTKGPDKIVGTRQADVIRLKGGNDRAWGNGGADRIYGGAGKDRLAGNQGGDHLEGGTGADTVSGGAGKDRLNAGQGADMLLGGAGNDVLNAADGTKDKRVDGGKGKNTCVVDAVDVPVVAGCGRLTVRGGTGSGAAPGGAGPPGGSGSGGGGQEMEPGSGDARLTVTNASGLSCTTALPTCLGTFDLAGDGAEAQIVTVTGSNGVTAAGTGPASSDGTWTATGGYSCTSDGFLVVSDGQEQFTVPVTCKVNQ
jgi:Ca2+-binding RTX toxin-like protein